MAVPLLANGFPADQRSWHARAMDETENIRTGALQGPRRLIRCYQDRDFYTEYTELGPATVGNTAAFRAASAGAVPSTVTLAGPTRKKEFRDHSVGVDNITGVRLHPWEFLRGAAAQGQPVDYAEFMAAMESHWLDAPSDFHADWQGSEEPGVTRLDKLASRIITQYSHAGRDPGLVPLPIATDCVSERQFQLPIQDFWDSSTRMASSTSNLTGFTLLLERALVTLFDSDSERRNRGDGFDARGRFPQGAEVWRLFKSDADVATQNHTVMWFVEVVAFVGHGQTPAQLSISVTRYKSGIARLVIRGTPRALEGFVGFFLEFVVSPLFYSAPDGWADTSMRIEGYSREKAIRSVDNVWINSLAPDAARMWAEEGALIRPLRRLRCVTPPPPVQPVTPPEPRAGSRGARDVPPLPFERVRDTEGEYIRGSAADYRLAYALQNVILADYAADTGGAPPDLAAEYARLTAARAALDADYKAAVELGEAQAQEQVLHQASRADQEDRDAALARSLRLEYELEARAAQVTWTPTPDVLVRPSRVEDLRTSERITNYFGPSGPPTGQPPGVQPSAPPPPESAAHAPPAASEPPVVPAWSREAHRTPLPSGQGGDNWGTPQHSERASPLPPCRWNHYGKGGGGTGPPPDPGWDSGSSSTSDSGRYGFPARQSSPPAPKDWVDHWATGPVDTLAASIAASRKKLREQVSDVDVDAILINKLQEKADHAREMDALNQDTFGDVDALRATRLATRTFTEWGQPDWTSPSHARARDTLVMRLYAHYRDRGSTVPMELGADEWVCDVTLDPNHPLAVLDAGSIPHILNLPPQRVGERARVVADRTGEPWLATGVGMETVVDLRHPLDYFGVLVTHPRAAWERIGRHRRLNAWSSSYTLGHGPDAWGWLNKGNGYGLRLGEVIRLQITGLAVPTHWPAWRYGYDDRPWGQRVECPPHGPHLAPAADFKQQRERGFVTLRVVDNDEKNEAGFPLPPTLVALEPPCARPLCREAMEKTGKCECIHCRLTELSAAQLRWLACMHLVVVFRLEVDDIPITMPLVTLRDLRRQHAQDTGGRGAKYRREVTPAPVRLRSPPPQRPPPPASSEPAQEDHASGAALLNLIRPGSRGRWCHPAADPALAAAPAGRGQNRLPFSRPVTSTAQVASVRIWSTSGTGGLPAHLRQTVEDEARRALATEAPVSRFTALPQDVQAKSLDPNAVPWMRVPAWVNAKALGLPHGPADGYTPGKYKVFLQSVKEIPLTQVTWATSVTQERWFEDEYGEWHECYLICVPWNQRYSTNDSKAHHLAFNDWDKRLCRPTGPNQEKVGERGRCKGRSVKRGVGPPVCHLAHLCNYCVCIKDEAGSPIHGTCGNTTITLKHPQGGPDVVYQCCNYRDTCHGVWTHLGKDTYGRDIRYPLHEEAAAAHAAHVARLEAALDAPEPPDSTRLRVEQANALRSALGMEPPPPADSARLRVEQANALRSALGMEPPPPASGTPAQAVPSPQPAPSPASPVTRGRSATPRGASRRAGATEPMSARQFFVFKVRGGRSDQGRKLTESITRYAVEKGLIPTDPVAPPSGPAPLSPRTATLQASLQVPLPSSRASSGGLVDWEYIQELENLTELDASINDCVTRIKLRWRDINASGQPGWYSTAVVQYRRFRRLAVAVALWRSATFH